MTYGWKIDLATTKVGAGGCYFCGGTGIGSHPECPAGNDLEDDDA